MSTRYAHLLSFVVDHPWAITPEMGSLIAQILARQVAGLKASEDDIAAALVNRDNLPQPKQGAGYAVMPIHGVIAPRMNLMSDISGGTSFERLGQQLEELVANKGVRTIVLDINSPGGSVAGASEFARQIMAARVKKPVIAQIHPMGASAAYWIAAAASKIHASPSAMVGSVGVYAIHDDLTSAFEKLGLKRTVLSAGEGKADGVEGLPMSAEGLTRRKALIDDAYGRFVGDVVRGRGKGATAEKVRQDWKAHVYGATEALANGMVDRICTMEDTIAEIEPGGEPGRLAAHDSTLDTTQEPATATVQDRAADDRQRLELALLDL
jgi:signal peptide peptidase SppA